MPPLQAFVATVTVAFLDFASVAFLKGGNSDGDGRIRGTKGLRGQVRFPDSARLSDSVELNSRGVWVNTVRAFGGDFRSIPSRTIAARRQHRR